MTKSQWQRIAFFSLIWFAVIVLVHYTVDFRLTEFVSRTFNPQSVFINFVHKWSNLGLGWPYLALFGVLFLLGQFVLHNKKMTLYSAYLWITVAVSGIVCDVLKEIFARPRPDLFFQHHMSHFMFFAHRQFHSSDYLSFPSGHATTAASVAIGIMLLFPRLRVLSILFMFSVAAARILLLRHFMADVMAGMYLGTLSSVVLYAYMKKFVPRTQGVLA
jgi:undecaprenyl-diphosphatase